MLATLGLSLGKFSSYNLQDCFDKSVHLAVFLGNKIDFGIFIAYFSCIFKGVENCFSQD